MKKITGVFTKTIIVLTIFFFLIILYDALFETDDTLYIIKQFNNSYIIYWFASILIMLFFNCLNDFINKSDIKRLKIVKILLVVLLFIGEIFIITSFNPVQKTDPFHVNDQAISIGLGEESHVSNDYNYFKHYSNNNGCLVLSIYLVKVFKTLNIDFSTGFAIFNAIMINLGILFTYLLARNIKDEIFATKAFAFSVLNPLNYLLINWTYTPTYSLPFMIVLIYLALLFKDSNNTVSKTIYSILFSICLVTGYYLRPTIVIPFISVSVSCLLLLINRKVKIKDVFVYVLIVLVTSSIFFIGIGNFNKRFVDNTDESFPITHWIMMGLHGDGTVTTADNDFTASFPTKEEKKKANLKEIHKTLNEYKIPGLIRHLIIKLPVTWSNGDNSYNYRTDQVKHHTHYYSWVNGKKRDAIEVYCQSFRIVTLTLCLCALVEQSKRNKLDKNFNNTLLIFGAILFYLIWEAKNAYSYPFLPFLFIMAIPGLDIFNKYLKKQSKKNINYIFITIITVTLLFETMFYNSLVKDKFFINDYNIYVSNNSNHKYIENINKQNKTIRQEFTTDYSFNRILIKTEKINDNDDVKYNIRLFNKNGVLLNESTKSSSDVNHGSVIVKINPSVIKGSNKFIVEIKASGNNFTDEDTINFEYLEYSQIKYYSGNLSIDNDFYKGNLKMNVYNLKKVRYLSGRVYVLLSIITICGEVFIYLYTKKTYSDTL